MWEDVVGSGIRFLSYTSPQSGEVPPCCVRTGLAGAGLGAFFTDIKIAEKVCLVCLTPHLQLSLT